MVLLWMTIEGGRSIILLLKRQIMGGFHGVFIIYYHTLHLAVKAFPHGHKAS